MKIKNLFIVTLIALGVISCNEDSTIGSSIVNDELAVVIDSTFTVTGHSVPNAKIQSRTNVQLLGIIDAKGYGHLSSEFVTQFMPANALDTVGVTVNDIDSLMLGMVMSNGQYVGDSIVPMGIDVYRLNRALPYPIFSNFNPEDYYSPDDIIASKIYNATLLGMPDSIAKTYRNNKQVPVEVKLPVELGREFFKKYKENPEIFNDPEQFAKWFPGLYIKNSYGTGRVMRFYNTSLALHYTKHITADSTTHMRMPIMAVTPEVVNNNNIELSISPQIKSLAQTASIAMAPLGYNTEVTLPAQDLLNRFRSQSGDYTVVNSMTFEVPAETIENDYDIKAPNYMLLVRKDKLTDFFATTQINDDVTSFYAIYNTARKSYTFSAMRGYFTDLLKKDKITAADCEFVLVPVNLNVEYVQSGYNTNEAVVVAIVPYVDTPAMVKFDLDKAKIKLTYSKQTINN